MTKQNIIPTINEEQPEVEEEKTQGTLDYEAGIEFIKNKDTSQAANAFHNAMISFEQEKNDNGIANAADKLGDLCAKKGDFENALLHYDRTYTICEKAADIFSLSSIEKKKAKIMFDTKKYDEALAMYLELLDHYSNFKNPKGSVETLEMLATIYQETGDKEKAADSYRIIAGIHKNFKHKKIAKEFMDKADAVLAG